MMKSLRERGVRFFAFAAGMALVMGAHANEGHGSGHGETAAEHGAPASKEGGAKEASAKEGKPTSRSAKGDVHGESRIKGEGKEGKEKEPAAKVEAASDAKTNVSMSELRDLIDQKIAEVRAKREAPAPVVRIKSKQPAVRAANAHGGGAGRGAGTLVAMNDSRGALLPLANDPHGEPAAVALGVNAGRPAAESHGVDLHGHDVHWAYSGDTGPESWGRLKPEFQQCMLGKRQSPIDIRDGIPVQLDPIQFDYRPSGFRVIDNGHTVQVNVEPGNGITVMGHRYELLQFHFHRPSEERINGRQYEMVAHLVHKDMDGKLAVVAVLMESGKGHPVVQQVWNNLPLEKNSEQAAMTQIDLTQLLPAQHQYYTYMGSLTTPPCSEGVLWMVMKQPAPVSREQIGVFAKLYPMNARPIQNVAGRLIKDGQ
jgi:carbonic anhydrase